MLNHNIDVGYYVRENEIKLKLILSVRADNNSDSARERFVRAWYSWRPV